MTKGTENLGWEEQAARIFESPGLTDLLATADSLDAIIKQIDAKELTATKAGRAYLLGASTALRATVAAHVNSPDYQKPE